MNVLSADTNDSQVLAQVYYSTIVVTVPVVKLCVLVTILFNLMKRSRSALIHFIWVYMAGQHNRDRVFEEERDDSRQLQGTKLVYSVFVVKSFKLHYYFDNYMVSLFLTFDSRPSQCTKQTLL